MEFSHKPVLLNETIELLNVKPGGIYADGTLGGGGHTEKMLEAGAIVYGIDRDEDAINAASARLSRFGDRFHPIRGNFHDIRQLLGAQGVTALDGVMIDLGVSSHQLDERERGFSYHDDAPLDMRMDKSQSLTAADIVNNESPERIERILLDYGEETWARQIVRVLTDMRREAPIDTTGRLVEVIDRAIPKKVRSKDGSHPARKTFQALRIAVNDELDPLSDAINDMVSLLKPGGRFCAIAFHSLEDRIVKNTLRTLMNPCICPPDMPVCVCGRKRQAEILTRKPVTASEAELGDNPRSRSATLRAAEKVAL